MEEGSALHQNLWEAAHLMGAQNFEILKIRRQQKANKIVSVKEVPFNLL